MLQGVLVSASVLFSPPIVPQRLGVVRLALPDDDQPGTPDVSIGALLEEIVRRELVSAPLSPELREQAKRLDEASLNAMTDQASQELCDAWDTFSDGLAALRANVSATSTYSSDLLSRLDDATDRIQRTMISPQRAALSDDLTSVRAYAESLRIERERRGKQRPFAVFGRRRRNEFWEERLSAAPPEVVAAAELSARALGFLTVVALLDASNVRSGNLFGSQALLAAWLVSFAASLVAYMASLTQMVIGDTRGNGGVEDRGGPERR